jgi:hypothetical protein
MKRIPWKKQWFLSAAAALSLGVAVAGVSAARTVALRPVPPKHRATSFPLPALDRMVAKLASEARARTVAANTRAELR